MSIAKPSPSYSGTSELIKLGASIREKRSIQGLSQGVFVDKAGLDRSYLGGTERGEHNIAIINLVKIAKALNISISELLQQADI